MKSADIRQSFIDFFREQGHEEVASAPLVPHGDPTLLFTNAGMVQFKDYFLGLDEPRHPRAVTSQKCLRVSGKHNDLENVGPSPRHHTFFEMLGNFSFGDYFKEDAIRFAWRLVTDVFGLPVEHLSASVFEDDDEAFELWQQLTELPAERIHRCGAKDNFWAMGDTGPCGPCSEIFVDRRPDLAPEPFEEGSENGRYLEIWNLVFMQFERSAAGELNPLPNPSIDTGAGLERFAAVLQGVESNYDTDLFRPILDGASKLAGTAYGKDSANDVSLRVIADHLRAVSFLLADGVIPGNEGRGYVLRRILRRAVRHGMRVGFEKPFLHSLLPVVDEVMGSAYPELAATRAGSAGTLRVEEEKFLSTLAVGARQIQEAIEVAAKAGRDTLDGETTFRLYDTYGLPIDSIREIAEEERFRIDEPGFESALEQQRKRSRAAVGDSDQALAVVRKAALAGGDQAPTEFLGYDRLELGDAKIVGLVSLAGAPQSVEKLAAGERGVVVFDRTVFYAESGGQVADLGSLRAGGAVAKVTDVQKEATGLFLHWVDVEQGRLELGASVAQAVPRAVRLATERNHTGTHLLHAALRQVLGPGVRQAGSLVAPDRLRFDFTHSQPMTPDEVRSVEAIVNGWVLDARSVEISTSTYKEAVAAGAMALFGEKYGDNVRTVNIPETSLELCGGCHVRNEGEIGGFVITSEKGIASGVRRIEALTGDTARTHLLAQVDRLHRVQATLGVEGDRTIEEVAALKLRLKELEKELAKLRLKAVSGAADDGDDEVREVAGVRLLVREVPTMPAGEFRNMADVFRSKLGSGVVVLGSRDGDKVGLVVAVTNDLSDRLPAGKLVGRIAELVGGRGGGRADFAQAGGRDPEKLAGALEAAVGIVEEMATAG